MTCAVHTINFHLPIFNTFMTNTYNLVSTSSNWQSRQRNCVFSGMTIDWQSSSQRVQGHLSTLSSVKSSGYLDRHTGGTPPLLICWHQPTALHKHYHRHHLHHNRWQFWGWERCCLNLMRRKPPTVSHSVIPEPEIRRLECGWRHHNCGKRKVFWRFVNASNKECI